MNTEPHGAGGTPVIVIDNVSFGYGEQPVLAEASLTIHARDFVCMVGPNGGGKTTLVRLILGQLRPDAGRLSVLGAAPTAARRRIGYVPQHFQYDRWFPIRVLDVVLMGRLDRHTYLGHYGRRDRAAAEQALEDVGLAALRGRQFAALSGGQRQRVLVARALASEPELFILDEPMSNIDPAVQNELYSLLRDLSKRLTVVLVTHDVGFVSTLVDHVVCVNRSVRVHPVSALTGEAICALYGSEVSLIRHDHHCAEEGHQWPNS